METCQEWNEGWQSWHYDSKKMDDKAGRWWSLMWDLPMEVQQCVYVCVWKDKDIRFIMMAHMSPECNPNTLPSVCIYPPSREFPGGREGTWDHWILTDWMM